MTDAEIQKVVLATLDAFIRLQAQALRQLTHAEPPPPPIRRRGGRRHQSIVDQSIQILAERRAPMHINELVTALRSKHGRVTDRDALASALGKKAAQGLLVRKTAPATFESISPAVAQ